MKKQLTEKLPLMIQENYWGHRRKVFFCPIDKSILLDKGKEKVIGPNGIRFEFPMYECPVNGAGYTRMLQYPPNRKFRLNGKTYSNLDSTEPIELLQSEIPGMVCELKKIKRRAFDDNLLKPSKISLISSKKKPALIGKECPVCGILYVSYKIYLKNGDLIDVHDFIVRRKVFKCRYRDHKIININAKVKVLTRLNVIREITIPAGYCANCNTFFIMESTWQLLKVSGLVLCRVSDEKSYLENSLLKNGMQLA